MNIYLPGQTTDEIVFGDGYTDNGFTVPYSPNDDGHLVYLPVSEIPFNPAEGEVVVVTTNPDTGQTTVSSGVSVGYLQWIMRGGWDTSARSIAALEMGEYLLFTTADITGACLMIGPEHKDGNSIHTFSHGLAIDVAGVHVYEQGVFKTTMRTPHQKITSLRIYRHANGNIVYVTTTGTETIVYTSLTPYPYPSFVDVYVYGYLYASGDQITSASFETGEVQYGSV